MNGFLTKKRIIIFALIAVIIAGGTFFFFYAKNNKLSIAVKSFSALSKISQLLPIQEDTKKELEVVDNLVAKLTEKNDKTWNFMLLLQNNMELRPGGGFLGQYALVKVKNGEVISSTFEDANLLDQRITAKVPTPYPLERMMQLKNWKFRDSNFSPDFPTNVEKAKYFYRLAGGGGNFDGIVAINATVFNDILKLTGPITAGGVEFDGNNGFLKLEEIVEKKYLMDPDLDTQNRKVIMKTMTPMVISRLFSLGNISKIANLAHEELRNKNVQINFTDSSLQSLVASVYWDGKVATDWSGDYLMVVDANMGALKTDYYIKRNINYEIDFNGEKPVATLTMQYRNTAPYGDWRTSDYHSYIRIYAPQGAKLLDRKMISPPIVKDEFEKTYFGSLLHVLIGGETEVMIKYELPDTVTKDNYKLLIQKQSGVGDIPVKVKLKKDGQEFDQEQTMLKDLKFEFQ
ncbi:MAG: DUF4012 domain-containing protein [Parcubacteria group bacterium]|jgi:hypothetical protein